MTGTGRNDMAGRGAEGEPPIRLRAEDVEDLTVIAACLQDAAVRVADMRYLPKKRRFAAVLNRYRWEAEAGKRAPPRGGQRVRSGIHFDGVLGVRYVGFSQSAGDTVLELLTLAGAAADGGEGRITMIFAGGAQVDLRVECIDVMLQDLTTPWPTDFRPVHFLDRGAPKRAR